jgi:hypothetical protein
MANRYVVSFRRTGLGDRIICLCAAWRFAHYTGRILLADWRYSAYVSAPTKNLFPLCFEPQPTLAGVPFMGDESVARVRLPHPRHPAIWDNETLIRFPFLRPAAGLLADRDAAVTLIRGGDDVAAPTVVFDACINDAVDSLTDARSFLGALRPVASVAVQVAAFREAHLRPGPAIGLHVRHGNGGDIVGHAPYWRSFDAAIARCERAIGMARAQLGDDAIVLLCTDSSDVQRALLQRIPGMIYRDKLFRTSGQGELHCWREAHLGRDDALVEMLLLAECDALIRYPPGSFFSFYAAAMKPSLLPPAQTVYDLQRPCDPVDALAPALLLRPQSRTRARLRSPERCRVAGRGGGGIFDLAVGGGARA